ncbi:MAG: hypothetical protein PHO66_05285 [Eubacteriales bacterium]|nr:hypothetical protein [Eubacteriales bacterium]
MSKRGVGAVFCLIAALLFSTRYVAAAIFLSQVTSWDRSLFEAGLTYVGTPLLVLSGMSLLAGFAYLLWAELSKKER